MPLPLPGASELRPLFERVMDQSKHSLFDPLVLEDAIRATLGLTAAEAVLAVMGPNARELMARVTAGAQRHGKVVIVDPKGVDYAKYKGASLLTPNRKEASLASGVQIVDDASLAAAARQISAMTGSASVSPKRAYMDFSILAWFLPGSGLSAG